DTPRRHATRWTGVRQYARGATVRRPVATITGRGDCPRAEGLAQGRTIDANFRDEPYDRRRSNRDRQRARARTAVLATERDDTARNGPHIALFRRPARGTSRTDRAGQMLSPLGGA